MRICLERIVKNIYWKFFKYIKKRKNYLFAYNGRNTEIINCERKSERQKDLFEELRFNTWSINKLEILKYLRATVEL